MKRIGLGVVGILLVVCACNNDLKTIGQGLVDNGNYIEEREVRATSVATVRVDSFPTSCGLYGSSAINQLILGKYQNTGNQPQGGVTTAIPYFQITPQYIPSVATNAVLDSTTFHIRFAGKIWGDTVFHPKLQRFKLHQLKHLPEFDYEKGGYFFNNTNIALDSCIGEASFYPTRLGINNSHFRIDDSLANDLFERIRFKRDDDIYLPNNSSMPYLRFLEYFKGLAIVPDAENDCLFAISAYADSLYLQFNYREGTTNKKLQFKLSQRDMQFNQFRTDTTGTPFEALTKQEESVSLDKAGVALAQGLSGYMIKMELPPVPHTASYTTIIKAEMEIKVNYIQKSLVPNPTQLLVYQTDDLNRLGTVLANSSDTPVTGTLVINESNPSDSRYIFDMTEYYQNLAQNPPTAANQQILIVAPNMALSYDYVTVKEKPIIRFYYANYKQ